MLLVFTLLHYFIFPASHLISHHFIPFSAHILFTLKSNGFYLTSSCCDDSSRFKMKIKFSCCWMVFLFGLRCGHALATHQRHLQINRQICLNSQGLLPDLSAKIHTHTSWHSKKNSNLLERRLPTRETFHCQHIHRGMWLGQFSSWFTCFQLAYINKAYISYLHHSFSV